MPTKSEGQTRVPKGNPNGGQFSSGAGPGTYGFSRKSAAGIIKETRNHKKTLLKKQNKSPLGKNPKSLISIDIANANNHIDFVRKAAKKLKK